MISPLKVSFIQSNLHWQDVSANLAMFEEMIWDIKGETDLIILPEMFNTGFTMDAIRFAEPPNLTTFKWMQQMALQTQAVITGSFIIKESGQFYNRLYWIEPAGNYVYYDKRHLFRMGDEHLTFTPGKETIIAKLKGWNIMPLICYDLRFPVWSRNRINPNNKLPEYDLLIFVANWPAARTEVWNTLLKARALENQCFCAGVNRIGTDGMEVNYNGHSAIYDYKGQLLNPLSEEAGIFTIELQLNKLKEFRMKFPAYLDSDEFTFS
jgi:predicted amidohydrolase